MTTTITATFTDGDESTTRTITLPHDVSDRVGELIGLGLLAELDAPHVLDDRSALGIEVHRDGGNGSARSPGPHDRYSVGDIIEVTSRPADSSDGPALGHRATVIETSDFNTLCIPWETEGHSGFWLSYDQVRRVDKPTPDYQIGDTVDASPSSAWAAGDRGTIVELDDDEDNFAPIWPEPIIAPDGTKTFTAPGMTCVKHPATTESSFPSWTITADAIEDTCKRLKQEATVGADPGYGAGVRYAAQTVEDALAATKVAPATAQWALDRWDAWAMSVLGLSGNVGQHGRDHMRAQIEAKLRACGASERKPQVVENAQQNDDTERPLAVGDWVETVGRSADGDPPIGHRTAINGFKGPCPTITWNDCDHWLMLASEVKRVERTEV